jgi:neurofibromin 1
MYQTSSTIQKYVWREIGKLDSTVVNVVLDELIRGAIDGGIGSQRCEVIGRIVSGLSSINVKGRLLSRLRRVSIPSLWSFALFTFL